MKEFRAKFPFMIGYYNINYTNCLFRFSIMHIYTLRLYYEFPNDMQRIDFVIYNKWLKFHDIKGIFSTILNNNVLTFLDIFPIHYMCYRKINYPAIVIYNYTFHYRKTEYKKQSLDSYKLQLL